MSKSAIESHRGDGYQNLLAAKYISLMMDEKDGKSITQIEIETTRSIGNESIKVDDFIVHYKTGKRSYCQCKKNQKERKNWTIRSLHNELEKAWNLYKKATDIESILFFSQNEFGELALLQDTVAIYTDYESFLNASRSDEIHVIYNKLLTSLDISREDERVWGFLQVISFNLVIWPDIEENIRLRLAKIATNQSAAYDAITKLVINANTRVKREGRRIVGHSSFVTRRDVLNEFMECGVCLAPVYSLSELQATLDAISSVGRDFLREIGGKRYCRPEVSRVIQLLDEGCRSILIEGGPGSGKSCVLLDIVEELEKDSKNNKYRVIFLQTKELADFAKDQQTTKEFVQKIARFAETYYVAVVMDSLDVIAISASGQVFRYFSTLIEQLKKIDQVTIIASCRSFDVHYDTRLRAISWEKRIRLVPWDWEQEVCPLFKIWGWNAAEITPAQQRLLTSPYMLRIYYELRSNGLKPSQSNDIDLLDDYLEFALKRGKELDAQNRMKEALYRVAKEMLRVRQVEVMKESVDLKTFELRLLASHHILEKVGNYKLRFGHQTYIDLILVKNAIAKKISLAQYASELPAVPFIRPIVRTYFFYLRNHDFVSFRRNVRSLLDSENAAMHLKRLVASSLGEIMPEEEDMELIQYLAQKHENLFLLFLGNIKQYDWIRLLSDPIVESKWQRKERWLRFFAHHIGKFYEKHPVEITNIWMHLLANSTSEQEDLKKTILFCLSKLNLADRDETFSLLKELIGINNDDSGKYVYLGDVIIKLPASRATEYDDLLFAIMTNGCDVASCCLETLQEELKCQEVDDWKGQNFLEDRLNCSVYLLEKCMNFIIGCVESLYRNAKDNEIHHLNYSLSNFGSILDKEFTYLILLVKKACVNLCANGSEWWDRHLPRFMQAFSNNPPVTYILLGSLLQKPKTYKNECVSILQKILHSKRPYFGYEACRLLEATVWHLSDMELTALVEPLMDEYETADDIRKRVIVSYLDAIPSSQKTKEITEFIRTAQKEVVFYLFRAADENRITGGFIAPKITESNFLNCHREEVLRLLSGLLENASSQPIELIGEPENSLRELQKAISRAPVQFDYLWTRDWQTVGRFVSHAILEGLSDYLSYVSGNLSSDSWEAIEKPEPSGIAHDMLTLLKRGTDVTDESRASVLRACSYVVFEDDTLYREIVRLLKVYTHGEPLSNDEGVDIGQVLNAPIGEAIEAAIVLFEKREGQHIASEHRVLLEEFSNMADSSVKAFYVERMITMLNFDRAYACQLFNNLVTDAELYAQKDTYRFLYYCYHWEKEWVKMHVDRMKNSSNDEIAKHCGLLTALRYLDDQIERQELEEALHNENNIKFSEGVWEVFAANLNSERPSGEQTISKKCLDGILFLFDLKREIYQEEFFTLAVLSDDVPDSTMLALYQLLLTFHSSCIIRNGRFFRRLAKAVTQNADRVAELLEILASHTTTKDWNFIYPEGDLATILTALLQEGESRELSDGGEFLKRILAVINRLQKLELNLDAWYDAFDRS